MVTESTNPVTQEYEKPVPTGEMIQAGLSAVFNAAEAWSISNNELGQLLGGPSRQSLYNWKKGKVGRLPHDTISRMSYLLGIWKDLQILYPTHENADRWLKTPNRAFGEQSPLTRMLGGEITDLAAVREYLDAARGGWS